MPEQKLQGPGAGFLLIGFFLLVFAGLAVFSGRSGQEVLAAGAVIGCCTGGGLCFVAAAIMFNGDRQKPQWASAASRHRRQCRNLS